MHKMLKRAWDSDVVAIFVTLWGAGVIAAVVPLLAAR